MKQSSFIIWNRCRPVLPSNLRPWPVAPRPFDEEAFGSWFGRIASPYQLNVIQAWDINQLGMFPTLTNAGWILFPPVPENALRALAALGRLDIDRLTRIQTPSDWMVDRTSLPYCFRCLVLNPVDVTAPRWKRRWLEPGITVCDEHRTDLEYVPTSILRRTRNMERLLHCVSKRRQRLSETSWYRRY
ncbi:TniQ family protein [Burkholderia latens]|uniref:TniQ family protein n=1 Tax=Burkholderia latens TaxID=488446 RepID=UPI00158968A4|nr:TniQ family protein [Burkholderia latens]